MMIQLGNGHIAMGDCINCMKEIETASVDLVMTDPPFSSGTRREASKGLRQNNMTRGVEDAAWFGSDSLTTNGFLFLIRSCAIEWQRVLKPGGHLLCFIDWRMMANCADAIESADLRKAGLLVWDKTYFGMGSCFRNQHELILHFTKGVGNPPLRKDKGNVLSFKPVRNGIHPTEKPVELLTSLIEVVCPESGVILDPFCGSGSSLHAAENTGRRWIGIERDPTYFGAACDRIARHVTA